MLFGQLHIVKNSKKDLEKIFPPMRFEGRTMSLNNVEEHRQRACPDVQLTSTHNAR